MHRRLGMVGVLVTVLVQLQTNNTTEMNYIFYAKVISKRG